MNNHYAVRVILLNLASEYRRNGAKRYARDWLMHVRRLRLGEV